MDITYTPMTKGFVYLTVLLGWHTRRVLSRRASMTMDVEYCPEAIVEVIARYRLTGIANTDQDGWFTSQAFTGMLKQHTIQISIDRKGSWRDNVCVERFCGGQ